ncbi:unnamed protein product [Linum trigynum]|uniref:Uncharacterized protein n=1 Tax=Linum trigynum TaxID=586398 RepID=A0AAV2CZ52_9ROSI
MLRLDHSQESFFSSVYHMFDRREKSEGCLSSTGYPCNSTDGERKSTEGRKHRGSVLGARYTNIINHNKWKLVQDNHVSKIPSTILLVKDTWTRTSTST